MPRYGWLVALQIAALAGACWAGFEYGQYRAAFDSEAARDRQQALQGRIDSLSEARSALRRQVAILERSSQIDREAAEAAKERFEEFEDERVRLQEDLAFYRGIVAPETRKHGLRVRDFQLEAVSDGAYRYRFSLTQVFKNSKAVRGSVDLSVTGAVDGDTKTLVLGQLPGAVPSEPHKFRFKYFQNFEGEFKLPEGFLPREGIIDVQPQGERVSPVQERFEWREADYTGN